MKRLLLLCSLLTLLTCVESYSQNYSIKVDALAAATTTLRVEGSMALDNHWSLHLPVSYNPWTFAENKKFKHISAQAGARYWMIESYGRGLFIGMNTIASLYNVGGMFGSNYRYEGLAFGIGASVGYSHPLSRRWNIEFEGGIGGVWTKYDKYCNPTCGEKLEKDKTGIALVPNNISVGIVYLF